MRIKLNLCKILRKMIYKAAKSMKLEELYLKKRFRFLGEGRKRKVEITKIKDAKGGGVHHVDQINIFNFVSFKLISYRN